MTKDPGLLRVLKCFLRQDIYGFTELSKELNLETDLTGYYVRKLESRGLLERIARGQYQLTPKGKSTLAHARQLIGVNPIPRITVMVVAKQGSRLVVIERQKQPFMGTIEWPTWPLELGVSAEEAMDKVMKLRLGSSATPIFRGFFRRIDQYEDMVFDDKLFMVCTTDLPEEEELLAVNETGTVLLLTNDEIKRRENVSQALLEILEFTQVETPYIEQTYLLSERDLYDI
jgi:predicted transcriptional regulator